jgi:hypothetical protein
LVALPPPNGERGESGLCRAGPRRPRVRRVGPSIIRRAPRSQLGINLFRDSRSARTSRNFVSGRGQFVRQPSADAAVLRRRLCALATPASSVAGDVQSINNSTARIGEPSGPRDQWPASSATMFWDHNSRFRGCPASRHPRPQLCSRASPPPIVRFGSSVCLLAASASDARHESDPTRLIELEAAGVFRDAADQCRFRGHQVKATSQTSQCAVYKYRLACFVVQTTEARSGLSHIDCAHYFE